MFEIESTGYIVFLGRSVCHNNKRCCAGQDRALALAVVVCPSRFIVPLFCYAPVRTKAKN